MSNSLFEASGAAYLSSLRSRSLEPGIFSGIQDSVHEHGLGTQVSSTGLTSPVEPNAAFGAIGGQETSHNLSVLGQWINYLNSSAEQITLGLFREALLPHVQADNRSVQAAFMRLNRDRIEDLISLVVIFVNKDIKHPIRTLAAVPLSVSITDHVYNPELTYTEEQTGNYHTLIQPGSRASSIKTWSGYLEDTPVVRRYLRYIDHLASPVGIRVVYCPKIFEEIEGLGTISRPSWILREGGIVREVQEGPCKALFVSLAFDYNLFGMLTRVETEVQPNQRFRDCTEMNYSPVVVQYLDSFIDVLKQLGAFSTCKIYYRASRPPVRS